ncbi:MAG TPA: rhodanese-like domain-containing protein, partial [Micromonosporaceae bacterium]
MTPEATRPIRVDAATLRELIADGRGPRLIDVRTPAEFETVHIPGAYNVPLDLLREHRDELRNHLD